MSVPAENGRTVLVTGGTTRIGAAISAHLAAHGWRVLTSSHRPGAGADILADLSLPDGPARLYAEALRLAPGLSAIVNNAAVYRNATEAQIEAVDYVAPAKLVTMLAGREGIRCCAVNILDAATLGERGGSAYETAKKRLADFTVKAAAMFADSLRVNAVAPGGVLAPEGFHEKAIERLLPVKPRPCDVAHAVRFLLENPAVTGCILPVDSGAHLI